VRVKVQVHGAVKAWGERGGEGRGGEGRGGVGLCTAREIRCAARVQCAEPARGFGVLLFDGGAIPLHRFAGVAYGCAQPTLIARA
jgi:hypothetical protein